MDKHAAKNWAASSINTSLGCDPVEQAYGAMPNRPKWVIGWAEDDNAAGAHCCMCWDLQLWTERIFANAAQAFDFGCEGVMAIHWRTAAIAPNIAALARAQWDIANVGSSDSVAHSGEGKMPAAESFWSDWGRSMFGEEIGSEIGGVLRKLDSCHSGMNALIAGGAGTIDSQISEFFAPLRELEPLRARVKGTGNLERFDYWFGLIRASELRVRTWVLAARVAAKMKEANAIPEAAAKTSLVRNEVVPLRLDLARRYEALIGALVDCARSPGELGTMPASRAARATG